MATIVNKPFKDRYKNDTFSSVNFTVKELVSGDPIDLTGTSIHVQFRYRCKTGSVVKDMEIGTGITLTDPTNGVFTIDEFTPIVFEVGEYYYDAQITFTDGSIKTYVWGTFKVLQDITTP
ncbi:MAG: hypothetical protein KUG64_10320 [Cycloclasticus sp.]|nr:hypothetical protein [Cycloclasticus sp.]